MFDFDHHLALNVLCCCLCGYSAPRRVQLMRSFGSMFAMMPTGGEYVWGNDTFAPDDSEELSEDAQKSDRFISYGRTITLGTMAF